MTESAQELALFSPSLRAGGAEQVMVTLANGLAARGIGVSLLLACCEGPFLSQVDPAVRVVDLKATRVRSSIMALARYLRRERPSALLSFQTHANLVAIAARSISGAPVRLVVSERSSFAGSEAQAISFKTRFVRLLARFAYRKADAVTVVAQAMVSEVTAATKLSSERVLFIPNPIVSPTLYKLAAEPADHPFTRQPGPPLIVSAGRLAPEKGFLTLVQAFASLRRQMEARLLILGEGPCRPALEDLVRELDLERDVGMPGFLANPFPSMKAASLYVLSSKFEGMPGALIQAMALGTPVVSTDCLTGPSEILEGGRWGKLVPVGNAVELAEAMRQSLTAQSVPDVASRAQYYSLDRAIAGYLEVLDPGGLCH
jgi:glycosyltransferase involved in cell wall biosynthesis